MKKNVLYHFDFIGDKLIIGKFCAIASNVKFIMNGANHPLNNFTTYPFAIFGNGWEDKMSVEATSKGDTIIGNDVWLGYNTTIMPGVKIGDGVIVATNSMVTKDIPAYHIVGGNPAQIIRKRFDDEIINFFIRIKMVGLDFGKKSQNIFPYYAVIIFKN